MAAQQERILIVENNPEISDLLSRQTLQPMGYRVLVVGAANQAIQEAARFAPDAIIADLNLPGLSGKDLLVALSAQGLEAPVMVIAQKGMEGDVIQAFRLGAADYMIWPAREAEVVSAVERLLKQVRARSERESLARQIKQTNQELQRRVRELTTIFAIGKAVTSITDQFTLFDKIVEGAIFVTEADSGWLLLRDERGKSLILSASRNLPKAISDKLNQPWDDGISSLVAFSGEALAIHGDPLKRFKVSSLGQSALVMPIKAKKEVVGLLVMVRKAPQPFNASSQTLLEAVADYASISLVNARLFKALEEKAFSLQQSADSAQVNERIKDEILQNFGDELRAPLMAAAGFVDLMVEGQKGEVSPGQKETLLVIQEKLRQLTDTVETLNSLAQSDAPRQKAMVDVNELARTAISRSQLTAQKLGVVLFAELSSRPVLAFAHTVQITKALEGLLSNAIKYSPQGSQVTVKVDRAPDGQAHILVRDSGSGFDGKQQAHLFERVVKKDGTPARRSGGIGISLALVREIIIAHGGKLWVDSQPGQGATFHFVLPASAV